MTIRRRLQVKRHFVRGRGDRLHGKVPVDASFERQKVVVFGAMVVVDMSCDEAMTKSLEDRLIVRAGNDPPMARIVAKPQERRVVAVEERGEQPKPVFR